MAGKIDEVLSTGLTTLFFFEMNEKTFLNAKIDEFTKTIYNKANRTWYVSL